MSEFNDEPGATGKEPEQTTDSPETGTSSGELSSDDRTMGMLCHLASFAGLLGVPLGHIVGPLIIWLVKKDQSEYVDYHGKESLNFQISVTIYAMISAILVLVVVGIFMLIAVLVFSLVVTITAAIRANNGEYYRYPLCIRFIN